MICSLFSSEIWDFMFLTKYCCPNGLTMHRFETPPPIVLDLGCGTGLWTIEAAKQWKVKDPLLEAYSPLTIWSVGKQNCGLRFPQYPTKKCPSPRYHTAD